MKVTQTKLPGVLIIEPEIFGDSRGFFYESFQAARYQECGMPQHFVQDNISRSSQGVLRGLHYQLQYPQGKLVWATRGQVFDVAVDIRADSPTFGEHVSIVLDDENHKQFYVPPGYAHGFCVLSETADFIYKCSEYYYPQAEKCIRWDDPALGIEWPVQNPSLSTKDQAGILLSDMPTDALPRLQ